MGQVPKRIKGGDVTLTQDYRNVISKSGNSPLTGGAMNVKSALFATVAACVAPAASAQDLPDVFAEVEVMPGWRGADGTARGTASSAGAGCGFCHAGILKKMAHRDH